jgi:hypothetical protein
VTIRRLAPWLALLAGIVVVAVVIDGGNEEPAESRDAESPIERPDSGSRSPSARQEERAGAEGSADAGRSATDPDATLPPGEEQSVDPAGEVPPGAGAGADRKAVVLTIKAYLGAIRQSLGRTACAQLTAAGKKWVVRDVSSIVPEVRGSGCEGAVIVYQGAYGDAIRNPKVRNLRVTGRTARAVGPLGEVATLVKQGKTWLITAYGR